MLQKSVSHGAACGAKVLTQWPMDNLAVNKYAARTCPLPPPALCPACSWLSAGAWQACLCPLTCGEQQDVEALVCQEELIKSCGPHLYPLPCLQDCDLSESRAVPMSEVARLKPAGGPIFSLVADSTSLGNHKQVSCLSRRPARAAVSCLVEAGEQCHPRLCG